MGDLNKRVTAKSLIREEIVKDASRLGTKRTGRHQHLTRIPRKEAQPLLSFYA